MTVAADTVTAILDRLERVRQHGDYWTARCPAHDDRNPSLSIGTGTDGRVLINCHAGCHYEDVLTALHLTEDDLFPERPSNGVRREVGSYAYTDELGVHLFDVVRFEPKTFRQRRPDGTWGLGDTRRVLYRLPEVAGAIASGALIYVVEGEKDADAMARTGVVATCNPMGAGKWRDEYAQELVGASQVVVVSDNDDVGRDHATQVAQSLERHSIPLKIVLPAAGKDASDHLLAGFTLDQFVSLDAAAEQAGSVRIVTLDEFVQGKDDVADPLIGTPDESLLPANGTLLMYGDGGAGKTTLSIDAMAHLASGTAWLEIPIAKPLRILLIENEGPRGPFRQRLLRKIEHWTGHPFSPNVVVLEEPWTRFTITDPGFRSELAVEITRHDVDLVIVGPLASLGAKGTGTPDEINEFDLDVKDLRSQAERTFALWIVHHENKAGDVSGAWERYPDSLVHVQAQGNGRTRVFWRKVRWSSELHGTSNNLIWTDGSGFAMEERQEVDLPAEITGYFNEHENRWSTLGDIAGRGGIGRNKDAVRDALKALVPAVLEYQIGPPGRKGNAHCWRLRTGSESLSHLEPVAPLEGFARATGSLARPIYEPESEPVDPGPEESDPTDLSQFSRASSIDVHDPAVQALLDDDDPWSS